MWSLLFAMTLGGVPADRTPVLVELFTSEGCSSCPPADRLLAKLAAEQPVAGALVVPISLHVDYWDRLGWADPFSSPAYSERQGEYARRFGDRGAYTPQMVVDGRAAFVGSDERAARAAIERAVGETRAVVRVAPGVARGTLRVSVRGAEGEPADVLLALTEDGLASTVTRGENAGRRLVHAAVARALRVIGSVDADGRFEATVPLAPAEETGAARRVFAFVQERRSGRVRGLSMPGALR